MRAHPSLNADSAGSLNAGSAGSLNAGPAGSRNAGSAMVELSLLMPILVLMLFGVIEFGIALQRWQIVTNAAREGARFAAVRGSACDGSEIRRSVEGYVAAGGLSASGVSITISNPCVSTGAPVTVTVRHPYLFPVLSRLVPGLGTPLGLTGRSVMRKE